MAVTEGGGGGGDDGRRLWPVAVVAGEEGKKGCVGNKRLVPLSSTYFDGTSVFHPSSIVFCSVPLLTAPNMRLGVLVPVCFTQCHYQTHPKSDW